MYHIVARAKHGNLFNTWEEAALLWQITARACAGASALCLMPNHVHLQHPADLRRKLAQALGTYVRLRNQRLGRRGGLLEPLPPSRWAEGHQKQRRETRYIHLNPCRAHMVSDPLAWPWSSYRDALGLALNPTRKPHGDPERLHRYTSADPSVSAQGTDMPAPSDQPTLSQLHVACSAALRAPLSSFDRRGPARRLLIQSARALTDHSPAEIAQLTGVSPWTVRRTPTAYSASVRVIERIAGDPRFPGIPSGRGRWSRG